MDKEAASRRPLFRMFNEVPGRYDLMNRILTLVSSFGIFLMWENFYNFNRPHKSNGGLTSYEAFREKMNIEIKGNPSSKYNKQLL